MYATTTPINLLVLILMVVTCISSLSYLSSSQCRMFSLINTALPSQLNFLSNCKFMIHFKPFGLWCTKSDIGLPSEYFRNMSHIHIFCVQGCLQFLLMLKMSIGISCHNFNCYSFLLSFVYIHVCVQLPFCYTLTSLAFHQRQ